jgi:hypothetical protein
VNHSAFEQEVVGTVRSPDGINGARIDGLVLRGVLPGQGHPIIDLPTAIGRAQAGLLWTRVPGDGHRVRVIAIDTNGDGVDDAVSTEPDGIFRNNLLALPIWDRVRRVWRDPSNGAQTISP